MAVALIKATARYVGTDLGSPDAPTYDQITTAFRSARLAGNERDRGNWIGPGPRVTRTGADAIIARGQDITVAWIYGWPTAGPWNPVAPLSALRDALSQGVNAALNGSIPFLRLAWTIAAPAYDPATNGPLDWWQSGAASLTNTRQEPREGVTESPWGPPPSAVVPAPPQPPATVPPAGMSTGATVAVVGGAAVGIGALAWYFTRKRRR